MRKSLVITADDFGLHESVNDGIEQASRCGVLTAASLMMAAPAVEDAIRRARRLPHLRVGLHLVLADGWATLAPQLIPALAGPDGRMSGGMFAKGVRFFALPWVRRQLEAEIRAQFSAFARTGLPLDHVNVHKHFHLHPTVLEMLIRIGREYGMPAVRVPEEPYWFAMQGGTWLSAANGVLLAPWLALMKRRLRSAGVLHNDRIFGLAASGAMTERRLLEILARLPPGITEIYLHPATESGGRISPSMSQYRHADELAALLSPRVRAAVASAHANLGGYSDMNRATGRHAA
jgi:hopanoid biosynthesis associated protein HpnK